MPTEFLNTDFVILNLHRGDFSTANNVAEAINRNFGADTAVPLDTNSIKVRAPSDPGQKVSFVSLLENLEVERSEPPAKIIINARSGTLVISGNVKVTPAAVSHGTLSVRVTEDQNIEVVTPLQSGMVHKQMQQRLRCRIRRLMCKRMLLKRSYSMPEFH